MLIFVKFLFKLHAIFKGSFSAERLALHAEAILMKILDLNKGKEARPVKDSGSLGIQERPDGSGSANRGLRPDQIQEILMMLQSETITGIQKYMIEFDVKRKEVQAKFESMNIEDKDEGLAILVELFQRCASYHDQLKLFALKA